MQYSITAFAALGFAAVSSAHMIMTTPVPYGKSSLNNSPLAADGSDFPCKLRGTTFTMEDPSNVMAVGSSVDLAFTGSAVHGGGSCQISIAMLPSGKTFSTLSDSDAKSLSFKVIHSIQGGCPEMGVTGNSPTSDSASAVDPSTYNFTIPASVPAGNATLAWTWFNKIGNREMYMNCAPVTITSATSKRDADLESRDTAAFDALPAMFQANIGNQCTSQDSKDVVFPNPGDSLVLLGGSTASSALATPTGAGCAAAVAASGAASASGAATTSAAAAATTASPAASKSASGASASGVFVTTPAAAASTTAAAASVAPAASTTVAPAATTSAAAAASPVASGTTTTTTGSGAAIAAGTACTDDGMFNCVSGNSFQQCASGTWSDVQSVADGTQCTVGQSMDIQITATSKRDLKFPREHIRRHLQRSI